MVVCEWADVCVHVCVCVYFVMYMFGFDCDVLGVASCRVASPLLVWCVCVLVRLCVCCVFAVYDCQTVCVCVV